jgi:hypothetical protein
MAAEKPVYLTGTFFYQMKIFLTDGEKNEVVRLPNPTVRCKKIPYFFPGRGLPGTLHDSPAF